jgi:hypothetical protein
MYIQNQKAISENHPWNSHGEKGHTNFHPKYGDAHASPHLTLKAGHSIQVQNLTLNMIIIEARHGE